MKHRYRNGQTGITAYIGDYAFAVEALLSVHQARQDRSYLDLAFQLQDLLIEKFWDSTKGGFFQTAVGSDALLVRFKRYEDGAYPSGANTAFYNMVKLAKLSGDRDLLQGSSTYLDAVSDTLNDFPHFLTTALQGFIMLEKSSVEIIVVGNQDTPGFAELTAMVNSAPLAGKVVAFIDPETGPGPYLAYSSEFSLIDGRATVYVCRNFYL